MKELKLVGRRLGGIECVGPPRGSDMGGNGSPANGGETTRQGIWAGAAQISCDLHNRQLLSSCKEKTTNKRKGKKHPTESPKFSHHVQEYFERHRNTLKYLSKKEQEQRHLCPFINIHGWIGMPLDHPRDLWPLSIICELVIAVYLGKEVTTKKY